MKNVYRVSTKQHGDMKSSVLLSKNATILQLRCASALPCSNMWNSNYPHRHVTASAKKIVYYRSRVAIDSTSWDYQACTRNTLWCQHYVTTSK